MDISSTDHGEIYEASFNYLFLEFLFILYIKGKSLHLSIIKRRRWQEKGPFDNFLILANVIARPASALTAVIQVPRSKEDSEQGE